MIVTESPKDITSARVIEQLTEKTGAYLTDSGDYYGRNHEINQGRDFKKEEPITYEFNVFGNNKRDWEILATINLYHWMTSLLSFSPTIDRLFQSFVKQQCDDNDNWLNCMIEFGEYISSQFKATGLYSDGNPLIENSYNSQNLLSQIIQYLYFEIEDGNLSGTYLLVQVHGGCDARGGYTAPKAYKIEGWGEGLDTILCSMTDLSLCCQSDNNHAWHSDDCGHGWSEDGIDIEDLKSYSVDEFKLDQEGKAHCPECGGKLVVSASI